jgi:crossover junction endodeoxyribonuclease RuvC
MFFYGIDPWIRKLWFAIIDENLKIYELWAIINELEWNRLDNARRMYEIQVFFNNLIHNYPPYSVCIEKLFFTKYNQNNAEFVYWVRWILLSTFFSQKSKIIEYTPKEIKKFLTWTWIAKKEIIQKTVKKIFKLQELPQPHDAADALWMAYLATKFKK